MRREEFTEEVLSQIKTLTKEQFSRVESTDETVVLRADVSKDVYCAIADIDLKTVAKLGSVYGILEYFENDGVFILKCETYVNDCMEERLSVEYESHHDFLDLFSKEEKADSSLENFFNDKLENVVRKLRETYPAVVESIEQNVISNIRDYDLDSSDIEYFAEDWVRDYPVESVENAESYLSDDDKKRFICGWVDNL